MTQSEELKNPQNSRRAAFREQQRRRQRRTRTFALVMVTGLALIISAAFILPNLPVSAENVAVPSQINHPLAEGTSMGNPDAPVIVTNYSDFKCIHCRNFWGDQEAKLIDEYIASGKVYYEYVPLSFVRSDSINATIGSYCAAEQDSFWMYHDYLFANYDAEITEKMASAIATKIGLDTKAFVSCFKDGKYQQQAAANSAQASAAGVTGTPTFSVNGTLASQAELFTLIEQALSEE